jgi:stage V sporulation protein G
MEPKQTLSPFSNIRINLVSHDVVKAMVSCKVADSLYLTGIRVMHGKHGRFVSMPSRKDAQGEYRDIFFPATKESRDLLNDLVLEEYDAVLAKSQG